MGNNSPGKIRRQGSEAYIPGEDPKEYCPYANKPWNNYDSWMEGWAEAERECDAEIEELTDELDLHDEIIAEIESDGMYGSKSTVSNLVMLLIKRGVLT